MLLSRVPGRDRLYVGGVWGLNMESQRQQLHDQGVTHILSVIKYSFDHWGEEAKRFPHHLSIDIDDDEDMDLLAHFPDAIRFIDEGLYPPSHAGHQQGGSHNSNSNDDTTAEPTSPGAVYVHCAMGKSRSVSCVIAYLLWKYPHRFGGASSGAKPQTTAERRATAADAVDRAHQLVREGRSIAEPNDGFMDQLRLWWIMGCPAAAGALENHPTYQKWLYERLLKEARDAHMPPDTERIRFEDEVDAEGNQLGPASPTKDAAESNSSSTYQKEVRCKKCRRTLATPKFVLSHAPTGEEHSTTTTTTTMTTTTTSSCAHVFIDTLSWMRPALEDGALEGRLNCPNTKCGATIGRFAWQGMMCSCKQWIVPAFSLNRSRVDEITPRPAGGGPRLAGGRGISSGHL